MIISENHHVLVGVGPQGKHFLWSDAINFTDILSCTHRDMETYPS